MTNPRHVAPSAIAQQAAQWFMRLNSGVCTEQEHTDFESWLAASAVHRGEYGRVQALWKEMDGLEELPFPELEQARAEWRVAAESRVTEHVSDYQPRAFLPIRIPLALAATLILALVAGWLWRGLHIEWADYQTAQGEQKTVILADGSSIIMNTDSRLMAGQSAWYRKVRLAQGEALFSVAPDKHRPFEVSAGNGVIRALGTRFNVYKKSDRVAVTLLEGRLRIATRGSEDSSRSSVELAAGYGIAYTSAGNILAAAKTDTAAATAWRENRLIFDRTSLDEALSELNRYRNDAVYITDLRLKALTVSGVFNTHDTDAFLLAVQQVLPVKADKRADGSVLLIKAPNR